MKPRHSQKPTARQTRHFRRILAAANDALKPLHISVSGSLPARIPKGAGAAFVHLQLSAQFGPKARTLPVVVEISPVVSELETPEFVPVFALRVVSECLKHLAAFQTEARRVLLNRLEQSREIIAGMAGN
jgi:hypothetical protein